MRLNVWRRGTAILISIVVFSVVMAPRPTIAGTLTGVRDYLAREKASLSSGEVHQLFFTTSGTGALPGTNNLLKLTMPINSSANGTWCSAAGSDISISGISDPDGGSEGATPLPLTSSVVSCTIGSVLSGDAFVIAGVGPLVANTTYGFSLTEGTITKLGTPPAGIYRATFATNNGTTDVDTANLDFVLVPDDQVVVTATVVTTPPTNTNPVVEFIGQSAPNGAVTITLDGATVSNTTADAQAQFDVTLSNQPTGQHIYVVSGKDASNRTLSSVTFGLNLALNTTTTLSGIFLGPSIVGSATTTQVGNTVSYHGSTVPNASINLALALGTQTKSVTGSSDASGNWSATVDTTGFTTGTYAVHAKATVGGNTSDLSAGLTLTITAVPTTPNPPNPPPVVPPVFKLSDINHDGHVNLIDFSIVLFYWHSNDPRVDLNHDGRVDIVDFSILMFQWTN